MNLIRNKIKGLKKISCKSLNPFHGFSAFFVFLLSFLSLTGFNSCINEEIIDHPEENSISSADFYISLNISLPDDSSTRSTTDNEKPGDSFHGTLGGLGKENTIETARLYFFDSTKGGNKGKQLCSLFAYKELTPEIASDNANQWTLTAKVEPRELRELIGKKFHLYVLANTTNFIIGQGDTDEERFLNGYFKVDNLTSGPVEPFGTDADGKLCPMANKSVFEITKLEELNAEDKKDSELFDVVKGLFTENYKVDQGKLWKVNENNALALERQIARIDFKDGSTIPNKQYLYKLDGATYEVGEKNGSVVYLKIVSMQLFNVGKVFYTFRHTQALSTIGEEDKGLAVFGIEKGNVEGYYNWIADSDWEDKKTLEPPYDLFLHQMGSIKNSEDIIIGWDFDGSDKKAYTTTEALSGWMDKYKDDWESEYAPWFYVTENTVPSTDRMNLQFATGILFRVLICDKDGKPVKLDPIEVDPEPDEVDPDEVDLDEEDPDEGEPDEGDGEDEVLRITMGDGKYQEIKKTPKVTDSEGNQLEPEGYYLEYKYLIEHNRENTGKVNGGTGKQTELAPMQIGVVRNNVYQLSVNTFKNLPDPNEPDNQYLSVDIRVLAWAKRDIKVNW